MPATASFDYAILRVVPRVERQEFINAGVVVFCLEKRYLDARIHLDEQRLLALWPEVDVEVVRAHLEALPLICAGDECAGSIAKPPSDCELESVHVSGPLASLPVFVTEKKVDAPVSRRPTGQKVGPRPPSSWSS